MNKQRTVCSSPKCVMAWVAERQAEKLAKRLQTAAAVKPIRESFQDAIVRRRKESETARKRRMKKTNGRAA